MDQKPVFYDPRGTRGTWATRLGAIVASLIAVVTTLTVFAALFTTLLPKSAPAAKSALPGLPNRDLKRADFLTANLRRQLAQEIAKNSRKSKAPTKGTIVAGFYAPWQASGLTSLRTHASSLTDLMPQWLHLKTDGSDIDAGDFDTSSNPGNREVSQICHQNGVRILPILDNQSNSGFDPARLKKMLGSEVNRKAIADLITYWVVDHNCNGINLDFELVDASENANLVQFLKLLRADFSPRSLLITLDIEAENSLPLDQLSDYVDWFVLMAYDQHSEDESAGPICDIDWSNQIVEKTLETVPNEKLVLGMGNYAYDWQTGKPGAENLTFQDALATASGYRSEPASQVIQLDSGSLNNTFDYLDDNDKRHVVWMLDAVSAFDQWQALRENQKIAGAALWYMGAEDPSIWNFFGRNLLYETPHPSMLGSVEFPYEVSFTGRGEILKVAEQPQKGSRKLNIDPDTGLIDGCVYEQYAFPYVVQKSGYIPNKLALTFDDGPDPQWTPPILQVLKDLKVPATFFVIGNSCESHPDLVGQEYTDGHEVGNHSFFHPNMGTTSAQRDKLELNLTQFAIEAATGRSSILFRPPYNADSEPETYEQLLPVVIATGMGYITVAENIDPTDWDLTVVEKGGRTRRKTAQDIISQVEADLATAKANHDEGNVILLHDGGGDRSATVEALKALIPQLRAKGYQFVPVAEMLGKTRASTMPPIPAADQSRYLLVKFVLGATYWILWILSIAFTSAIFLGLARVSIMTALALVKRRTEHEVYPTDFQPPVTVLIAAYNEQTVIVRTIESVLRSNYPVSEVVVIDDGSQDKTSDTVRESFAADPRVRLLVQENGGKSSALNHGITVASGEILFCIDADTQLDPDAISLVTRHFADEKVGAVAGNVRVGNPINVITYWQSLEYTTSQNLDRRAYALLNAITVVPGAIGGWRRKAVLEVGGYQNDTLAEDMDLTWRLRKSGYRLENEANAYAYTEAPETFGSFFKQRFRWAYGTLQCLFKHRRAVFHYGWFGGFALPSLWIFQIGVQGIAPLVDLEVLVSVIGYISALANRSNENGAQAIGGETQTIIHVVFLYGIFFLAELVAAAIATKMERQRFSLLWWLFLQRFAYRQIMYGVIYRSLVRAVTGGRTGWGKLDRTGRVKIPVNKRR